MTVSTPHLRLPSRYEDLDVAFRSSLRASRSLIDCTSRAFQSMEMMGGIRFLPVYGKSGSGKTSAALELGTHLPEIHVHQLSRNSIASKEHLDEELSDLNRLHPGKRIAVVIDQYEEAGVDRELAPKAFVEFISILDRDKSRPFKILFVWLTTSREFQRMLVGAASRNERILVQPNFEIAGPSEAEWPGIIEDTFRFHNDDKQLADLEVLDPDLEEISKTKDTVGSAIEATGERLFRYAAKPLDISQYQVVMLWPVTDGERITKVSQFTQAREGYLLDWHSWLRQINPEERRKLPLREYNRARLYFDLRLVPIAAADLQQLCRNLMDDSDTLHTTYLSRLSLTHFYSVVSGKWNPQTYKPLRERTSNRAEEARKWYPTVTTSPTLIGKRLAKCLTELGLASKHEQSLTSPHSTVRADVLVEPSPDNAKTVIVELKAFSPEQTMPSTIAEQIRITLRRHAQYAGFLSKQ